MSNENIDFIFEWDWVMYQYGSSVEPLFKVSNLNQ